MSIYRRINHGKRSKYYCAEFRFHNRLYRRDGFPDRKTAAYWVASEQNKLRRGEVGYIAPMHNAKVAPLMEEFTANLEAKGRDAMYCYTTLKRLQRLMGDCGWVTLGNITAASLVQWQKGEHKWRKRTIGNRTKNQYVEAAKEFGDWLIKPAGKLSVNPLADVDLLSAQLNQHYRRAATVDELDNLLATCPKERRTFYSFILYHALRIGTIRGLTWGMLHLDDEKPWGKTPATLNKSRRDEKFPIRHDVAAMLRKERGRAGEMVFSPLPTLDDLKNDLVKAGVAFDDGKGNRRLDYHSLRKTLVRLCKLSGVSLDAASLLLHHKSVGTTRRHYDDDAVDPLLGDALERLPAIGRMRRQA